MSNYQPVMKGDFDDALKKIEGYLQQLMDRVTALEKAKATTRKPVETKND